MAMLGADVDALSNLAVQLKNAADQIHTLQGQLSNQLGNVQWVGSDANNFRNEWSSTHVAALNNVVNALQQASTSANTNAQQQRQTSA